MAQRLERLEPGQVIPYGGNRCVEVPASLADAFRPGDHLVVVDATGDLLHIPATVHQIVDAAVERTEAAFGALRGVSDEAISTFFDRFAARLADDESFSPIADANRVDVERAAERGRSTTRLVLDQGMRTGMVDGLRMWRDTTSVRDREIDRVDHDGWSVSQRTASLGVVGFVFEGRPNVFADACGVIRTGNAVVFRIGSDALATAEAIVEHALDPALLDAGLPPGTASLVASPERSAGWALFADRRLSLAVARGSGPAVAQLGAVAQQSGTPVSLHGTGGAWIVTGRGCDADILELAVANSLDRKVCNTLNTVCVLDERFDELAPRVLAGLHEAARARRTNPKLHVAPGAESAIPAEWFTETVAIERAEGPVSEPLAEMLDGDRLGHEWEWENSPEITLVKVDSTADAIHLFNTWSPRFAVSLISDDEREQDLFYAAVDSPFVGNGFTRWVDGQYALGQPELGLSNWQFGRLFGRGGVLSGASVFTVRLRADQRDPALRR